VQLRGTDHGSQSNKFQKHQDPDAHADSLSLALCSILSVTLKGLRVKMVSAAHYDVMRLRLRIPATSDPLVRRADAGRVLTALPRQKLGFWPTRLHRLDRLSEELSLDLWIKRDDESGFALGGNKVRKLEFLLAEALRVGSDLVITTGGSQSNHARLTAAAARKLGLDCHLVLDRGRHPHSGNLLLDRLFGAVVELIDDPDPEVAAARMEEVAACREAEGHRPFVIPRGGSIREGAVGYASMIVELAAQLDEVDFSPEFLYVATGSAGTHSGIMAGRAMLKLPVTVQGVSVSRPRELQEVKVSQLSNHILDWLDIESRVATDDVLVDDRFVGGGYGVPTEEVWEAIRLVARLEGIVLDPVYTGKAMAGLIGHARERRLECGASVIFLHTGGSPALFGYALEAEANV